MKSLAVRHEDYTLAVGEFMTPEKAKAFVARYAETVEHWVKRIERKLRTAHPHNTLHVRVYSADTLVRQYNQRGADDYRIAARHVANLASGGTDSYAVVVEWDTEAIIVVGGGTEWIVTRSKVVAHARPTSSRTRVEPNAQ